MHGLLLYLAIGISWSMANLLCVRFDRDNPLHEWLAGTPHQYAIGLFGGALSGALLWPFGVFLFVTACVYTVVCNAFRWARGG